VVSIEHLQLSCFLDTSEETLRRLDRQEWRIKYYEREQIDVKFFIVYIVILLNDCIIFLK